jgi:4,5-dihydroxyphthalate decarboxylase
VRAGDEHVAAYRPPPKVVSAEGADLGEMLAAGELDAAIGIAGFPSLIEDPVEAGLRALRERGHYPINHLVVVRDGLVGDAPAVYDAFVRAKEAYLAGGELDPTHARVAEAVGGDPLPYGLDANRAALEELVRHALQQHLLRERPDLDSLFARV